MHDGLIEKGFQPVDSGLKLHHPTCGIMNVELKMLSTCRSENGVQMACILILISKFYIHRCLSYLSILTKFNCPSATFILRIDTKIFFFSSHLTEYFTFIVVAGEHDLTKVEGSEQESNIAEFIVHPGYSEVCAMYIGVTARFEPIKAAISRNLVNMLVEVQRSTRLFYLVYWACFIVPLSHASGIAYQKNLIIVNLNSISRLMTSRCYD